MATWQQISEECFETAKHLAGNGYWRASINRSYYAAYCAVTGELVARGMQFAHGWNNPPHDQVPEFIANNLSLPQDTKRRLQRLLRILRRAREDADYRPGITTSRTLAIDCLRNANVVLGTLHKR